MKCPKCKEPELIRADTSSSCKEDSHMPYACPQCHGMWMTIEEANQFSESMCMTVPQEADTEQPNSDIKNPDAYTGLCPLGHGLLIRARIDADPPFFLERCTDCGGIWFDQGEWHRLAENHLLKHLSEFWTRAWQRKQRQSRTREIYLERLRKRFGDDLFKELVTMAEILKAHPHHSEAMAFLHEEITSSIDK